MAVNLSPIGGVAGQFFDNNGVILSGGKIYIYSSGTTTNQATYTSAAGVTAHTNPIILDSAGRVPSGEIWLTDSIQYKFVIKTSADVILGTYDNIIGINSNFLNYEVQEEIQTATAGQTVFTLNTVTYTPNTNTLQVFVDGVNQYDGVSYAYVETDSTTVTFTSGLHVGALVKFTTAISLSSGVTDAALVTYDPPFTGGVATNVENKLAQYVSVKDFGAIGDGTTDDTDAIQSAISSLTTDGGAVYFPRGVYKVTSALTVPSTGSDGVTLIGEDEYSSVIKSYVSGTLITSDVAYLHIEKLFLEGDRVAPLYWTTGYTALQPNGNLTMANVNIRNFDVGIKWNGGYYHKYNDCSFVYLNNIGTTYNGNNCTLFGCKISYFNNGFQISGGTGDFVFQSGSIEAWSGNAIAQASGSSSAITVRDTYVENYPATVTTGTGLNPFTAAYVVTVTKGDVCFENNNIQTQGVLRGVYAAGASTTTPVNITASGNKWITSSTAASDMDYCYYVSGSSSGYVGRIAIQDPNVVPTGTEHTGSYTLAFIPDAQLDNVSGYNSLTKQALLQSWQTLSLVNGWANQGSAGNQNLQYYKDSEGIVHVYGLVDGTSSTNAVMATLPVGYRPQYYVWAVSSNTSGTIRVCRVTSDGEVRIETATPGNNNIFNMSFRQYQ